MWKDRWKTVSLSSAFLVAILVTPAAMLAQDESPEASPVPGQCTVEPRPTSFIAEMLLTQKPIPLPTVIGEIPVGEPVDPETRSEIEAVIDELTACTNAGDYLRAFALFDIEYLRRLIDPEGLMAEAVAYELGESFSNITPAEPDQLTQITGIDSIQQMPDGTVVAIFRTRIGGEDEDEQTDMLAFRDTSGSWKIVDGQSDITK